MGNSKYMESIKCSYYTYTYVVYVINLCFFINLQLYVESYKIIQNTYKKLYKIRTKK